MVIRLLTLLWVLAFLNSCGFEGGIVDNGSKPSPPKKGTEANDKSPDDMQKPGPSAGEGPSMGDEETVLGMYKVLLPVSPDAPGKSLEEPSKSPDAEGYLYRNGPSSMEFKPADEICAGVGPQSDTKTKGGFLKTLCSDSVIHLSQGEHIVQLTHDGIGSDVLLMVIESLEIIEHPVTTE